MCPIGVTCLPTHLFSLLDTNNFISEGGGVLGNQFFFHTSGRSKICLYMHEVKYTCIRDKKKNKCVLRVTGNPVKKVR